MAEFRCIKMLAITLLALHLTVAASQYDSLTVVVREGDEASLPCRSVNEARHVCDSSDWLFLSPGSSNAATVFQHGQENHNRVTANCSLVIKNVTAKDVGFYTCRTFIKPGYPPYYRDANVYLFLVNMAKREDNERVELSCSLRGNQERQVTLEWQYDDITVNDNNMVTQDVKTRRTNSVTVTFPAHDKQKSELFKCYVRDDRTETVFTFSYPSSGKDATTASTTTTITTHKRSRTNLTDRDITKTQQLGWWLPVVVGSAALVTVVAVIAVVVVVRCKRTKGEKVQVDGHAVDPEEGVSYASISFTKKTHSKALLPVHDEGDAVTYSTVKLSSSSRGICADSNDVYATINKAVR